MSKFTDQLFGSHSENERKKLEPIRQNVECLRDAMRALSDSELAAKTEEFRKRLENGESLDDLLPESFAAMREADRRILSMEPFPVQILAGIVIHQGRIAECKTGEGKTLTATLPVYFNALSGNGVLVVTVNDYLAKRDREEMGPAYEFMGLSVGVVTHEMGTRERKEAYACDITYVTNTELGFDYLRDHIAKKKEDQVLRGLSFALIDEADSVLIDEARTPLIISGDGKAEDELLTACDTFVKGLTRGEDAKMYTKLDYIAGDVFAETGDYSVDEKDQSVSLTEAGARKAEEYFHVECLTDPENRELSHRIQNALKANTVMKRDRDYIVKDDEVQIVDEFTGRVLPGRRFSDGLHQALEVKEGAPVNPENTTLASITYQSFFNHFAKKAGMTGTGIPAEAEFRDVYSMDVIQIPTNRPVIRTDEEDVVYATRKEKEAAIVSEVKQAHENGQPVLVGTKQVEDSERLSDFFTRAGIPHVVLNARQDADEAEIVAKAGQTGAVTIATNMAGRGTDIKLSEDARKAGGLYVIGTERSESRRIDDQLIGRSGRQGDPGKSKFFLSLEDDLIRLFAPKNQVTKILSGSAFSEGEPVNHPLLTKAIENAQSNMESTHAAGRRKTMEYDEVGSGERDFIYKERDEILSRKEVSKTIIDWIRECAADTVNSLKTREEEQAVSAGEIANLFSFLPDLKNVSAEEPKAPADWVWPMQRDCFIQYQKAIAGYPKDAVKDLERWALLTAIDRNWSKHLDDLDFCREAASLHSYAGKDPMASYRQESAKLFEEMMREIRKETIALAFSQLAKWKREKEIRKPKTAMTTETYARFTKEGKLVSLMQTEKRDLLHS